MKIHALLYSVFSLPLIAFNASAAARYNNDIPTCENLGYVKNGATGCDFPIRCPFDSNYAVCISNSCRGYKELADLQKEYTNFGKILGDMCSLLESCKKGGSGAAAITTYRCKSCKKGVFDAGICLDECDRKKFPKATKPEELYGHIISCTSNGNTYYAYDYCNDGWDFDAATMNCSMTVADRKAYPYDREPPANRGKIEHTKAATSIYYGYSECYSGYTLKLYSSAYKTGSCIKSCNISSCSLQSDGTYKCPLPSDCMIGDSIKYNNVELGVLIYKAQTSAEHNLLVTKSFAYKAFGMYGKDPAALSLTENDGKKNTADILRVCNAEGYACDSAKYCNEYSAGVTYTPFAKGQWFLGAQTQTEYLANSIYSALFEQLGIFVPLSYIATSNHSTAERSLAWYNYEFKHIGKDDGSARAYPMLEF